MIRDLLVTLLYMENMQLIFILFLKRIVDIPFFKAGLRKGF